jgi:rhodanese-related sulfurtransferase
MNAFSSEKVEFSPTGNVIMRVLDDVFTERSWRRMKFRNQRMVDMGKDTGDVTEATAMRNCEGCNIWNWRTVNMRKWHICGTFVTALLFIALTSSVAGSANFSYLSKDDLRIQIDSPDITILDVRPPMSWMFSRGKIKGAIREDPGDVSSWQEKYQKDKPLVLYCQSDVTSSGVARQLLVKGFEKIYVLRGGWSEWSRAQLPIEKK